MNPYESTNTIATHQTELLRPQRPRVVSIASVATTAITMPCAGLWTIEIIDSLVESNMGFWMIILLFFCVLAAIPLGLFALVVGRALVEFHFPFRTVLISIVLAATFPLTYHAIAFLAVKRIEGFWQTYASLVGATGMIPFVLGTLVYCLGQRIATSNKTIEMAEQSDGH
jgi:ABC-type glycerol-3-phosphate transport system permease component